MSRAAFCVDKVIRTCYYRSYQMANSKSNSVRAKKPVLYGAKYGVLGVVFHCPVNLQTNHDAFLDASDRHLKRLARAATPYRERQKRKTFNYVDLLTLTAKGELLPSNYIDTPEGGLVTELAVMLREGDLNPQPVRTLCSLPWIRSRKALVEVVGPWETAGSESPTVISIDTRPWRQLSGVNLRRAFEVEMEAPAGDPRLFNWGSLFVRALLVHIYADLEVFLDTGLNRVSCCQRSECHGFFEVKRMGKRQMYCSTYCRVAASRKKG